MCLWVAIVDTVCRRLHRRQQSGKGAHSRGLPGAAVTENEYTADQRVNRDCQQAADHLLLADNRRERKWRMETGHGVCVKALLVQRILSHVRMFAYPRRSCLSIRPAYLLLSRAQTLLRDKPYFNIVGIGRTYRRVRFNKR